MDKIFFLDIDGVLNSDSWNEEHQKEISDGTLIDVEKIKLLAQLIFRTGAEIILHSGWRFWFGSAEEPLCPEAGKLLSLLSGEGLRIAGMTPILHRRILRRRKRFCTFVRKRRQRGEIRDGRNNRHWKSGL